MDFTNLKEIRKEKGLNQEELSQKSGVGRITISRLESGALKESSVSTLMKIAKALECDVEDIVGSFDNQNIQSTIQRAEEGEEMDKFKHILIEYVVPLIAGLIGTLITLAVIKLKNGL